MPHSSRVREMTDGLARDMSRQWNRPTWWMLLIAAPWMIGATFCMYVWYTDRAVALRQQTTSGTIVAHKPASRNRYGYTFNVNEKTYGGGQVSYGDEQFAVGQVVTVHYDPLDPNNSALVDFNESSSRASRPVPCLVLGVLSAALIIFGLRRETPKPSRLTPG